MNPPEASNAIARKAEPINFGSLRRLNPVSKVWGNDRGYPIDRYYIESFLEEFKADIHGRVLEVADNDYTLRFGGSSVTQSDILHATPDNPKATIVSDLVGAENIPGNAFDCVILTQVMQYLYDARAAVRSLHRILKPGGVVLVTLPCIEKVSVYDDSKWGEHWRFTVRSGQTLFAEVFGENNVTAKGGGNVLVAISSLMGLAQQDLKKNELDYNDPDYPLNIAVRAVKQ